jgi:hypothetical protein
MGNNDDAELAICGFILCFALVVCMIKWSCEIGYETNIDRMIYCLENEVEITNERRQNDISIGHKLKLLKKKTENAIKCLLLD